MALSITRRPCPSGTHSWSGGLWAARIAFIELPYTSDRTAPSNQAKKAAPSFHGVVGILLPVLMLLVVALGQQRASTVGKTLAALHHVSFCLCVGPTGLLFGEALEAVLSGKRLLCLELSVGTHASHSVALCNQQEQPIAHHARSAAAHALLAAPGAGFDKLRQPASWAVQPKRVQVQRCRR